VYDYGIIKPMQASERAFELQALIGAYQQRIRGYEQLIPAAEASAARGGFNGRYWRKQGEKYQANLVEARYNLGVTQKELDALRQYPGGYRHDPPKSDRSPA
jgi:hypothetical protein